MVKRALRWGTTALLLVLATGCATGRAVRAGQDAVLRGDWDTAVAYYRQAHASDPGRIDVKISLERATREAANVHSGARASPRKPGPAGRRARGVPARRRPRAEQHAVDHQGHGDRAAHSRPDRGEPADSRGSHEMQQQAQAQSPIPRLDPRTRVPIINFPERGGARHPHRDEHASPASTSPTTRTSRAALRGRTRSTCRTCRSKRRSIRSSRPTP